MTRARAPSTTVGILHLGEMGAAVARGLTRGGTRVVTSDAGRSRTTSLRAIESGVMVVPTTEAVLEQSDIVVSLVLPEAAREMAAKVAQLPREGGLIYVDANSVSAEVARRIQHDVESRGIEFVDAAIHGLAPRLARQGTLLLSGRPAAELEPILAPAFARSRVLDGPVGAASAVKMILSGLSKSLVALIVELEAIAEIAGVRAEASELLQQLYPSVVEVVERTLPSYPTHHARRAEELREIVRLSRAGGLDPRVIGGSAARLAELASVWVSRPDAEDPGAAAGEVLEDAIRGTIGPRDLSPDPVDTPR